MATYLTTTSELTAVADAIRAKAGTASGLEWPDEFVSTISAIPVGINVSAGIIPSAYTVSAHGMYYPTVATMIIPTASDSKYLASALRSAVGTTGQTASGELVGYWSHTTSASIITQDNSDIVLIPEYMCFIDPQLIYVGNMDKVQNIELNAFSDNTAAMSALTDSSLRGAWNLSLPEIRTIGATAFYYNQKLGSITLGTYGNHNLESIGLRAFANTPNVNEINILETPTGSIFTNAFADCGTSSSVMNVVWSSGAVANAPWGFAGTINYNYVPSQA